MVDPASYQLHPNGPLKPDVIKFLTALRAEKGWSYKTLGERLSISQAFTHNILNKAMNITTVSYMPKIAAGIDRLKEGDHTVPNSTDSIDARVAQMEHVFQLRPGLTVTLKLPTDLTEREAERFANFIRSVPL